MPTLSRKASRSVISRTISRAIARSVSVISSVVDPLRRPPRAESVAVLGDADPADLDREALRPQPGAVALRAGLLGHVALDPLAVGLRVGLFVAALELVDDPLEADLVGAAAAEAVGVGDLVALAAGAVEEDLALGLLQLRPGLVDVDAVLLGDGGDQPPPVGGDAAVPRLQRALGEREGRVGDDQLGVDHPLEAEPVAALAGAVGRVEGEDPRLQLGDRGAALEAGELLGEEQRLALAVDDLDFDQAAGEPRPRPRPTRRGGGAGPASSPAGRRRSRCRVCTSCRGRSPRRGGAARRRPWPASSPRAASARAASRTRLCGPRTTGAMTMNLVPSSRVISRSTICSWVWPVISAPHSGQCGTPIRAQSRRR